MTMKHAYTMKLLCFGESQSIEKSATSPLKPSSKRSQANELKIVLDVTGYTKKVSVRKMTKMTERTETSVGTFLGIVSATRTNDMMKAPEASGHTVLKTSLLWKSKPPSKRHANGTSAATSNWTRQQPRGPGMAGWPRV